MYGVLGSTGREHIDALVARDTAQIADQSVQVADQGSAVLGTEDDVQQV
jgi:hypothetical protein